MPKISFKKYLLNRIKIYSLIFFISALTIIILLTLYINREIKTAIDEQLNFVIKKSVSNYDLQITSIENDLNEIMFKSLEDINSYDIDKLEQTKKIIIEKSQYSHLIENVYYFLANEKGIISKTNYSPDLNLDLSKIDILWNDLSKIKKGEIHKQALTHQTNTNNPWLYIYKKISNGDYIEIGIDFKDEFNTIIFKNLLDFVEESNTIQSIEIYTPYFTNFIKEKELPLEYIQYFQSLPENEINYIDDGFYKFKTFLKINSQYGFRYIILNLDYVNSRNIFISMIILIGIVPILLFLIIRFYVVKQTYKIIKPINDTAKTMKKYTENNYSLENLQINETNIKEIDSIKDNFFEMTKKIKNTIIEQETTNRELEEMYENNEILIKKINRLIRLTVDSKKFENLEDFLKYLFNNIFDFIPEADYGSLSIIKNGKRHFIDSKGHNLDILEKIDLDDGLFVEEKEIKIVEDILEYDRNSIPENEANLFIKASKPIRSTLIIPFNANDKIYGNMNLDIDKFSNKHFTQESLRFSKFFSDIITSYIIIAEYQNLDSKYKEDMIKSIINLVEIHDNYTKGHSSNVSKLAIKFSKILNLEREKQYQIYWAALIHDMGKIVIPFDILNKPSKLTEEEFQQIKKHPDYAYNVLKDIDTMREIALYIKHHHERIDGKGYPDKLKGDEIPFESKIICICDAWDAMTSKRSYKRPLTKEQAIQEISKNMGTQFDKDLAEIFLKYVIN
ncbi:MAG: HD domain-containing phosphohydrolase [Thermotogota bacterium]